jgi:hypothetical protein
MGVLLVANDERIVAALKNHPHLRPSIAWNRRVALDSDFPPLAIVVQVLSPPQSWALALLDEIEKIGLVERTVVISPFSRSVGAWLGRVRCAYHLWLEEAEQELPMILDGLLATRISRSLRREFASHVSGDPMLARIGATAFSGSDHAQHSVSALAKSYPCDASSLWRHWKDMGLPDSPRALVDWAMVARALDERLHGRPRSRHRSGHRYERTCARLGLVIDPRDLDHDAVLHRFREWLSRASRDSA